MGFAVVYWNARELSQEYVIPRFFLVGWLGAVPTLLSAVGVYAFNQQFKLMSKEVRNGLFGRRSYLLVTIALEVPYTLLMALSAVVIPLYVISTGNWTELLSTILVMASALWCFERLAHMFGVIFTNPLTGMLGMLALWIVSFLFSGIFLKPDQIVWFLNDSVYLLPLFYCFRALHHVQFSGTLWDGAELSDAWLQVCPTWPLLRSHGGANLEEPIWHVCVKRAGHSYNGYCSDAVDGLACHADIYEHHRGSHS